MKAISLHPLGDTMKYGISRPLVLVPGEFHVWTFATPHSAPAMMSHLPGFAFFAPKNLSC
jgi:hypothetical protein